MREALIEWNLASGKHLFFSFLFETFENWNISSSFIPKTLLWQNQYFDFKMHEQNNNTMSLEYGPEDHTIPNKQNYFEVYSPELTS